MRKRWIEAIVEDHLGDRRQLDARHLLDGALGGRIEAAGALQHVAEEVEPHRAAGAGREEVDQPAAQGELAGLGDGGRLLEAHAGEIAAQGVDIDAPADLGGEARGRERSRGTARAGSRR